MLSRILYIAFCFATTTLHDTYATETSSGTTTSLTTDATTSTTQIPDPIPQFVVKDSNITCIILKAKLEVIVPYFSDKSEDSVSFSVGSTSQTTGKCEDENDVIELSWIPENSPMAFNLSMNFSKAFSPEYKSNVSILRSISFQYYKSKAIFPYTNETGAVTVFSNASAFETTIGTGYKCTSQQNFTLYGSNNVTLGVSFLQVEVFRNSSSTDFTKEAVECTSFEAQDMTIPILVGVSAAILIVLAVIAFLVGNRRRAQGYQNI